MYPNPVGTATAAVVVGLVVVAQAANGGEAHGLEAVMLSRTITKECLNSNVGNPALTQIRTQTPLQVSTRMVVRAMPDQVVLALAKVVVAGVVVQIAAARVAAEVRQGARVPLRGENDLL
jgi:hypothetical protein